MEELEPRHRRRVHLRGGAAHPPEVARCCCRGRPTAEGEPEEDPRQELVERLLEYRRLKEAAQSLAEVDRLRLGIWTRKPQPLPGRPEDEERGDRPRRGLALRPAGRLQAGPRRATTASTRRRSSCQRRGLLGARAVRPAARRRSTPAGPFDLLADLRRRSCRAEAIAAFLAVLELARLNLVRIHQTESRRRPALPHDARAGATARPWRRSGG